MIFGLSWMVNRNREIFFELLLPTFFVHLTRGLLLTTLPYFVLNNLGRSETEVGMAVGAIGLGKMLIDVPGGMMLGFLGARKLMIICGAVISSSSLLMLTVSWYVQSFALVVIAMFLMGAGEGIGIISRLSQVSDDVAMAERGRVSALLGGSSRLAMALGPLLSLILATTTSSSSPNGSVFILQIFFSLVSVILVLLVPKVHRPPGHETTQSKRTSNTLSKDSIRNLAIISVFMLIFQIARECRKLLIPLAGVQAGYRLQDLSYLTTASFTIDAILFFAAGVLMDQLGNNFTGVISLAILTLSLLVVVPGTTLIALALHAVLAGIGNGLSSGIAVAFGADLAPPGPPRSKFIGLFRLCTDAGELIGPVLVGLVSQYASTPTMINVIACTGIFGIFWIIRLAPAEAKFCYKSSPSITPNVPLGHALGNKSDPKE